VMEEKEKMNIDDFDIEPNQEKAEEPTKQKKKEQKEAKHLDAKVLEKQNEELNEKLEEANDRYLRLMAEYDNYRKRSQKEKEAVYADAYEDCIGNILPILDNLDKASQSDNIVAVKKGLELMVSAFEDALKKMGIEEIETKTFDPNVHNAVMHIEDDKYGENEIVAVFQKGYKKGDKVIRHAMVQVAN